MRSQHQKGQSGALAIASGLDQSASQAHHRAGSASPVGQNAELVALGVGQDHPGLVALPDVGTRRPELKQALDLALLIVGPKIDVEPVLGQLGLGAPGQREDRECGPASVGSRTRRERRSR